MSFKTTDTKELRRILHARRLMLNMTQQELSKKAKIPQATLSKIEKYDVKLNLQTLFKLLKALDLNFTIEEIKQ